LRQLAQQVTPRHEVCGRKALAESAVHGGKEIACLREACLGLPKPSQADRAAQFPGQSALSARHGRVEQSNFDNYQILRMNEAPAVEVQIVPNFEPPGGMGEAGTSAIVPAVANAIFAVTGKRLRKMPIDPAALKSA
jgi:hypothetical protein